MSELISHQWQQAKALKEQGHVAEAVELLEDSIRSSPFFAPALNNLGSICFAQGKWEKAEEYYNRAIEAQPNYEEAYYNLGLAYIKLNQFTEAIDVYTKLIQLAPHHLSAQFQLACLWMTQQHWHEAIDHFCVITAQYPEHFETEVNLATCFLKIGNLFQAECHYLLALQWKPQDTQILYNLGVIQTQQGKMDLAIQYYRRVLEIDVDLYEAHYNLAVAYLAKQYVRGALFHFREAMRIHPEDPSVLYLVQMLEQKKRLPAAPIDYLKKLFNAYADHYESHLIQTLHYQVSTLLYQTVVSLNRVNTPVHILDLGCGTGLCGTVFKPLAKTLIGVDIAENMLHIAAKKNIYDELVLEEMEVFLSKYTEAYDLIVAADVFVYIGDLEKIFKAIEQALLKKGLFVFNAELSDQAESEDFFMLPTGRFAHTRPLLDRIIQQASFEVLSYQSAVIRSEQGKPVYGHIYVCLKRG